MHDPNFVVDAVIAGPGITVELRSYDYPAPFEGIARRTRHTLSMALSTHVPYSQMACLRNDGSRSDWGDAGDVIFMPAGVNTLCRGTGGAQRRLCCSFDPGAFPALAEAVEQDWTERDWIASCNVQSPVIKRDLYRLANEVGEPAAFGAEFSVAMAGVLTIELSRYLSQTRQLQPAFSGRLAAWQMRRITDYVEGQVEAMPRIDELAKLCQLSPRHLGRAFKNHTGQTLGDYVKAVRLQKAKRLLVDTDLSLKEIAHRLGFSSPSSFSVAFGKATGFTPGRFRQLEAAAKSASANGESAPDQQ